MPCHAFGLGRITRYQNGSPMSSRHGSLTALVVVFGMFFPLLWIIAGSVVDPGTTQKASRRT
jgi:hypothetical protein